ncbi:hypothetical protein CAY60_007535 [Shouchella clausii]|jgi:DNA mismatch repair ATPase MutL|uniref:Uncharacterized protein n=1 Tax=Shouchella rhizosphaerae TaxID=866786 RepID=A0ABZ2CQV3_9BACI|nr:MULTISPECIES: hypothetical protein [Shouchella]MCM3312443.1 hypothetical protein [Psychrobacillus sp. MER TA 17]ALA51160.1 hypothetical protein DB29_00332 [Shouchella clausii]KKI84972.1 hypothetical protein WZ76_17590 [Shouchella clausii]MBU3231953.1 hypothetical protein [Shouchella clausii]MBU3264763.1 hypothetical protein [Shouchella clausii]
MSGLFDFLFANPFLVIILVGGLVSLFSRIGQATQQQNNRGEESEQPPVEQRPQREPVQTQPRVDHRQPKQQEIRWEDYFPQESAPPAQPKPDIQPARVEASERALEKTEKLQERRRQLQERVNRFKEAEQDLASKKRDEANAGDPLDLNLSHLSGKEAMKAVVLAEILGPPKGRKLAKYPRRQY